MAQMPDYNAVIGAIPQAPLNENPSGLPNYESMIDGESRKSSLDQRMRATLYPAVRSNPEGYAEAKRLGRSTGIPAEIAERNLDDVRARAKLDELAGLAETSPRTAGRLADPDFARLAHDDTPNLAEIERTVGVLKAPQQPEASVGAIFKGLLRALPQGLELARQGVRMQFGDLIGSESMRADAERKFGRAQSDVFLNTPEFETQTGQAIYGGGSSLMRQLPGWALAIATRSPTPALATMGGQVQAEGYGKYRSRGATAEEAFVGGTLEGGVEIATELLPMSFLVNKFGKAGAAQFIGGLLAREIPGEQIATFTQDAIDTAIANPTKTWNEFWKERPDAAYQTMISTITQAGAMGAIQTAVATVQRRAERAVMAERGAEALTQLDKLAAASKLRARDPQSFASFIQEAADEGPVRDLFVDASALSEAVQAAGEAGQNLLAQSPAIVEQLAEALNTGGSVRVPIGEYASTIAGTDVGAALLPHLKTSPGAMSQAEAQVFYQEQAEELRTEAERILNVSEVTDAWAASSKEVGDKMLAQLQQANRFTPDVNTAYASLVRDFYTVTAQRLGITPTEMYARYPLRVAAENVMAEQQMDQRAWLKGADGAPLVVYRGEHGAPNGKLQTRLGSISFASRKAAELYANVPNNRDDVVQNPRVIAARITIANPVIDNRDDPFIDFSQISTAIGPDKARAIAVALATDIEQTDNWRENFSAEFESVADLATRAPERVNDLYVDSFKVFDSQEWVEWFKAAGFDGAIHVGNGATGEDVEYKVFSPEQVEVVANAQQEDNAGQGADNGQNADSDRPADRDSQALLTTVAGGRAAPGWVENARFRRSDGKPATFYRGAGRPLGAQDFLDEALGVATGNPSAGLGVWFTISQAEARQWGEVEAFHLDIRNPKVFKIEELPGFELLEDALAFREQLKAEGFDGLMIDARHLGGRAHAVAFNAEQVIYPALDGTTFFQQPAQLDSPAFAAWFGNSKAVDESGQPLVLYHGTTSDFEVFDRSRANPEGDMGAGFYFSNEPEDVGANYAGEGPDLTAKLEMAAERIFSEMFEGKDAPQYGTPAYKRAMTRAKNKARKELGVQSLGFTMPVYLSVQTPLVVGGANDTFLGYAEGYDEINEEYTGDESGELVDFILNLRSIASRYYDGEVEGVIDALLERARDNGGIFASDLVDIAKGDERFQYFGDDSGKLNSMDILRQAVEATGYDAIFDYTADKKFGSQRGEGREPMKGMNPDTVHYIVFEPTQIKSAIGNRGTFDANNPNILYQAAQENPGPLWFSQLERQVEAMKMNAAPMDQWKATIKALTQKGVKPDEIEWTGINEWLDNLKAELVVQGRPELSVSRTQNGKVELLEMMPAKSDDPFALKVIAVEEISEGLFEDENGQQFKTAPRTKVTKAEVLYYLKSMGVQVKEITYGKPQPKAALPAAPEAQAAADTTDTRPQLSTFEITFESWETDEPDDSYLREQGSEYYLQGILEEMADEQDIPVDELDDSDRERAEDKAYQMALNDYWNDSESPQHRDIRVYVDGTGYNFTWEYGYGDNHIWAGTTQDQLDLPRRADDDADVTGVIREHLRGHLGVQFEDDADIDEDEADTPDTVREGRWSQFQLPGGEDYRELLLVLPTGRPEDFYYKTHYPHPNILAHVRFNDRTDAEGKRVLFFEEVQSDWGQQGRESGFATPEAKAGYAAVYAAFQVEQSARYDALVQAKEARDKEAFAVAVGRDVAIAANQSADRAIAEPYTRVDGEDGFTRWVPKELLNDPTTPLGRAQAKVAEARTNYDGLTEPTKPEVPPAPFVAKTEAWAGLVLKRMIRYAAEHGYDRIAWTTGRQQVDRWERGLRERVDAIKWVKTEKGVDIVAAKAQDRYNVVPATAENTALTELEQTRQTNLTPEGLAGVIGSTMAADILSSSESSGVIQGDGLRIDDKGMHGFYGDEKGRKPDGTPAVLTNAARDVLKKLGGQGVGTAKVRFSKTDGDPVVVENQPPGEPPRWRVYDTNGELITDFPTQAEAEQWAKDNRADLIGDLNRQPAFDITPEMKDKALQGMPLFQKNRGQIAFGGDITTSPTTISLLANADLSTFLHEFGHFQLEVMADIASRSDAPPMIVEDMNKLLQWFGVPDLATWRKMSLNEKRPHHEQYAKGFEKYLFEGRAPNIGLQSLFGRLRSWMLQVYRSLTALDVKLTDEVRGVMDRLLATHEQIMETEQARGYAPAITSAEQVGWTAQEWQAYQEQGADGTSTATDQLQMRTLRDMKWLENARSRELKRLQREAATKRKAVRREVEDEVLAEPIYQALRFIQRGELREENREQGKRRAFVKTGMESTKLSLDALREMYGEEANAPWRYLSTGKFGLATAEGGLHPDMAAELFGFQSGDELVRKLLAATPAREMIDQRTDQRMLERFGDLIDPDAINTAADLAVHNEARARFVATEANALAKATGQPRILAQAAKAFAEITVARKRVRDIKPSQYAAAEARAARAAAKAMKSNDLTLAATEKRNQLLNFYGNRAATRALDEVEKGINYLKKFGREGTRKSLDVGYLDQIDKLLERFELKAVTNKALDRRASLLEWVKGQQEQGFEPTIDDALLSEAGQVNYRELPLEQLRGVIDAVRNIEHLARLKKKLLTARDQRDFDQHVARAAESIRDNAKNSLPERIESNTWRDRARQGFNEFFAIHRKFSSLLREMDGHKDGGVMWELFARSMNERGDREAAAREKATIELTNLFKPILAEGKLHTKTYIPAIDKSLSREGRLMVALNWGNETNRQRVMSGDKWNELQVGAILDTLTKQEWDFVQGVWDYVNRYWPDIADKEKRVSGTAPEKVEASPINTKHGTYAGGYFPIKYDPQRSSKAESDNLAEAIKQSLQGLYTRATTRRGHTKARVDEVKRPVRKDFGVLFEHVDQVIHDLSWHEWLIDANRLMRAEPIDAAIREHYGPEVLRTMKRMLDDIAAGDVPAENVFQRGINWLRTGATIAGLGWNLSTAFLQPLGLTQSMVRIGPKWVGKGLSRWLRDAATMENTAAWIYERSDFMRLRGKTMQREINEIRNRVANDKSGAMSAAEDSFFYMIQKMQLVADIPTWLGQYEKEMAASGDEAKALALADQAVIDAQGGGQIKDLAQIQRGGPLMKLWTNFYSFFNTTYNLTAESVARTDFKKVGDVGRLATDMLLLYTIPAVMGALIKEALRGGGGDDEDKIIEKLIREQLNYLLGTMVGLRELGGAIQGFQGYTGPGGMRFFSELYKFLKQAEQGEIDKALLKAGNNAAGILLHYPAGQVQRTSEGIVALAEGKTSNPGVLLVGPAKE